MRREVIEERRSALGFTSRHRLSELSYRVLGGVRVVSAGWQRRWFEIRAPGHVHYYKKATDAEKVGEIERTPTAVVF